MRSKTLRMDSTQIASDIRDSSRLHLLVEGVNRLYRLLDEEEQAAYALLYAPYIQRESKQYVYGIKGREAVDQAIQRIGPVLAQMLTELKERYSAQPVYQTIQRLFDEHYRIQCDAKADGQMELVEAKANDEIGSGALQSLDDLEATFRHKAGESYQGYVANISETCDDDNDVQLIVKAQVAPNNVDDAALLVEAMPDLVERTEVETMHTDGGYGSAEVDRLMNEHQVEQPTAKMGTTWGTETVRLDEDQDNSIGDANATTADGATAGGQNGYEEEVWSEGKLKSNGYVDHRRA